jgi:hypothetical protein
MIDPGITRRYFQYMKTSHPKKQGWTTKFLSWLTEGAEKSSTSGGGCPT